MKVLQNLYEGFFKARNFQAIFNTSNQADRIDFSADVLEQSTNESWLNAAINRKRIIGQRNDAYEAVSPNISKDPPTNHRRSVL